VACGVSKDLGSAQIEIQASKLTSGGQRFSLSELRRVKEDYDSLANIERQEYSVQLELTEKVIESLSGDVKDFLQGVFKAAHRKEPDMVNQKIRLVVGGGGSQLSTYRLAATNAFTIKDRKQPVPPEVTVLQKPYDFQMKPLPNSEFHRFAIAYGLSYPFEDLPKPILSKDVLPVAWPKKREKNLGAMYEN